MKNRIRVSPWAYALCWWSALVVHFVCAVFICALGAAHEFISLPDQYTYTASSLQIPRVFFILSARSFFVVTSLHLLAIGRMIYHSVRLRQLSFHAATIIATTLTTTSPQSLAASVVSVVFTPIRMARQVWSHYLGIDGLFGLNGPYFDTAFRVRELIEVLSQSYQAYILSCLMTTQWINQFAVAILVIGCVATPVVEFLWRHSNAKRRFASLLVDTLLDFSGSVVIPVVVAFDMVKEFDWQVRMFPSDLAFDNVWLADVAAKGRLMFVWSTVDYLTTLILQLSVLGCMLTLATGLERRPPRKRKVQVLAGAVLTHGPVAAPSPPVFQKPRHRRHWKRSVIDGCIMCWGLVILFAHVAANLSSTEELIPSCALGTHAWFQAKPGCAVMWVNCYQLGIIGTASEVSPVLDQIDRSSLRTLAIMHCPGFTMPDILQEFGNLHMIELVNVTLVSWPQTAAVTNSIHPQLGRLSLGHVNLTTFPQGILHAELPLSLTDLDFSYTNVTQIPESLGEYWSNRLWLRVNFEYASLSSLPQSFSLVPIRRLSLIGNRIAVLADTTNQAYAELYVSGNPLKKLPASIGDTSLLRRVSAENTMLSTVPPWWNDWYNKYDPATLGVRLYATPLCDVANTELTPAMKERMCVTDPGTVNGTTQWEVIWRLRPVNGSRAGHM